MRATTTVTLLGGTTEDEYGDERDVARPLRTGVIASIIQASPGVGTRAAQVQLPDTGTPRTIRSYACRLPANTDMTGVERLRDERTGAVYVIDGLTAPASPINVPDLHLQLRRIT
ncbi:hypothetical protein [Rhizomonospora bruguierae]|uniref:hypothetical protein n=1 Tax=Rhizomonospora bruguierae TaxID=1581705 RepID=UPI001BD19B98|nr:hypothetical protein [Micromonospora sp. NBRC 107566]